MATINQVAQKAGVSPATVSHVINNTRFVSPAVRTRVRAAMDELGYRPNALARSLRRGETHTLGLILPDSSNPFFAEVAQAIELAAFDSGYSVILCNSERSIAKERHHLDVLLEKQVDGLILMATGEENLLCEWLRIDIPIVLLDRDLPDVQTDVVLADNRHGGLLATQHLIELGHRRIACISGPSYIALSARRVHGYFTALSQAGLPLDDDLIARGGFDPESGLTCAMALLQRPNPPTAIFACNDLMAIGAMRAAGELGCPVPASLSIVGFDDIQLASFITPSLTTITQPKVEMGRQAVRLLVEKMADRTLPAQKLVLLPKLIVRESSTVAPA